MAAVDCVQPGSGPQSGDAFEVFFRSEYPRALRLAWLLTHDRPASEDIAQEAMIAVHARFDRLDNPPAYLSRVVVNVSGGWHRRAARQLQVVESLSTQASGGDPEDDYLLDALHALPYRQRVVIVARYWAGWSEAEIAAALGCRQGTVKSLCSRALSRLRLELDR
jgi:RNA polymerase sigma-70 factor (sigma-E family)